MDSAPHTLDGNTADAFATAISNGLTGLAALAPATSAATHHYDAPKAATSCPTTAEHASPGEAAAAPTAASSQILAKDADPVTATDIAAQHASAAAAGSNGGLNPPPSVQAHGSMSAHHLQHGSETTAPPGAVLGSPLQHASDSAGGTEVGAFLLGFCTGLQCLQSLAARERAFRLAPESIARMAHAPWQLLQVRSVFLAPVLPLYEMHTGCTHHFCDLNHRPCFSHTVNGFWSSKQQCWQWLHRVASRAFLAMLLFEMPRRVWLIAA